MNGLVEMFAGWPFVFSFAAAITVRSLFAGRRRTALNEALHELRRPLQALALATGPGRSSGGFESSLRLATVALERLDREVNGRHRGPVAEMVWMRPVLESAVARWGERASVGGSGLVLRWRAADAVVEGDVIGLSQALDNLIVNAIEHGGPSIVVEARSCGRRLRVSVADWGRDSGAPASHRGGEAGALVRIGGRRRRGHGLGVVRRTAAAHDGRFALRRSQRGSLAVLDLPLAGGTAAAA